jgi:hypothetical protein
MNQALEWLADQLEEYGIYIKQLKVYSEAQEMQTKQLTDEMKRAYKYGQSNSEMMEAGLERDEVEEYANFRMLTITKNK